MNMKSATSVLAVLIALSLTLAAACWAADVKYPAKPIHMWVGFAAGGSTDICARSVSSIAEKSLGQPIVVENKPGGGGALLLGLLASATPDGYTLATTSDTPYTRAPHLINVKYDPMKDFIPLVRLGLQRQGIVVRADSPFKKWQDLIDFARKNPGQLAYGTPGPGTTPHLAMEKIALQEKVKFQHIPFQGDTPAMSAVLGGHVMAAATGALAWTSHVKAGTLRLLLVFDPEGMDEWPEVPTFKKVGYNFEAPTAQMVSCPKGVPKPVIDKLITVFSDAVMSPQFQKVAREQELLAAKPLTGADFQKWLQQQYNMYGTFIKEVGLQKKTE
jgi:tripartite-type tricarboxylate transporter receptor subunit TctC